MLSLKSKSHCEYLKSESICQLLYFRDWVARAGSKLYGPGIFPSLAKHTRLAWPKEPGSQIALVSPLFVYPIRPKTWHHSPFPLGSPSRSPMHSRDVAVKSNEHFCRVMFSWVRFLHYTSCGPPWHLMQAIITSEERYKRDSPLKAFLWYLTPVHQTHQYGRVQNQKTKQK